MEKPEYSDDTLYDGSFVGWQEYSDDTMYAVLNLYNAKIEATDTLLDKQKEYINNLKEQFSSEEKALGTKWEVEDRNESKSEISHKLSIYKNAVTQKGYIQIFAGADEKDKT